MVSSISRALLFARDISAGKRRPSIRNASGTASPGWRQRRPRGHHRRIVARYVGNDQGQNLGWIGGEGETATGNRRQVLPHAVDGGD